MHRSRSERAPSFFWQGVLIILPVIALAGVGLASLRQDRLLAESEARAKANATADALVPALQNWFAIRASTKYFRQEPDRLRGFPANSASRPTDDPVFAYTTASAVGDLLPVALVGPAGDLIYPPPLRLVPTPQTLNMSRLTSEQSNLWSAALEAEFVHRDSSSAAAAWDHFLNTSPPDEFAARACYDCGLMLRKLGQTEESSERFGRVMKEYGTLVSEAGIPYRQLALLQCANDPTQPTASNSLWSVVCKEAVTHPTILSELLLSRALEQAHGESREEVENWVKIWNNHQDSREVYEQLYRHPYEDHQSPFLTQGRPIGQFFWFLRHQWFVFAGSVPNGSNGSNVLIVAESAFEIQNEARFIFGRPGVYAVGEPDYLGVDIELQGRHLLSANNTGVLLASREIRETSNDPDQFGLKLNIYLADPDVYYAHQHQRALIFGSLVAAAAIAALVGFFAARRAFHRQLHLSEMKSNFVSSVSHELRAPIASVRLMAEGLERGKVQDAQKQNEYFRFIVQECRRLSSLIENVLDFSRIEQGRKQYEFEPTDVVVLSQQTVKLMDTYATERQIKLALQITGTPFPYEMDGKAMQQALINLLDNAIKHSSKGSSVTVGLEFDPVVGTARCAVPVAERSVRRRNELPESGAPANSLRPLECGRGHRSSDKSRAGAMSLPSDRPILRFWVEDHGEGIPPEEHEKIFERFYRLGSELRRETQGVGIGLSIVKHIVEAHGGKIVVRSAPGQGSRFTIELPAKKEQS